MENVLAQLITLVQEAAPALWEILRRQVYVCATQLVIGAACSAIVTFLSAWASNNARKKAGESRGSEKDDAEGTQWFFGAFAFIAACATIAIAASAAARFINPNYYAIELLLKHIGQ